MDVRGRRQWPWVGLLVAMLMLAGPGLGGMAPSLVPSSLAAVALAKDTPDKEDRGNDDKKDNHNKGDDDDEDHVARGQVIGINTLADPPELTLASFDGEMLVRVMKTDEIALNGVKLCQHIRVDGEKIHEHLFEATRISVETKKRC